MQRAATPGPQVRDEALHASARVRPPSTTSRRPASPPARADLLALARAEQLVAVLRLALEVRHVERVERSRRRRGVHGVSPVPSIDQSAT